jgi:hypothetical protein
VSPGTRTEMRRCGKPYASLEEAARSKRALAGTAAPVPCVLPGCGSWHLEVVRETWAPSRPAAKDTGPGRVTRAAVLDRDGWCCARCGRPCGPGVGPYSLQHRKARGVGGGNEMSNLLVLCGSATTLCHGEVESKASREDNARGYWLESWQSPLAEGVMYFEPDGSGVTRWLHDDGSVLFAAPAGAV